MNSLTPFHLAVPVHDLQESRIFYRDVLNCEEGRSSDKWVDFNFFGHQFVIHETGIKTDTKRHNKVDGHDVPVPHFGVILKWNDFQELSSSLKQQAIKFLIEPYVRFEGQTGEQATMFFLDPSGNALEFKAFKDLNQIFKK